MTHPLRFGLKLSGQDTTIEALRAVWRTADESGFDHVWDFDFDGDPNIVEVYVRRLRTKLHEPVIETIRGAGYRLVADRA